MSNQIRSNRVKRAKELIDRGHYERDDVLDRTGDIVLAELGLGRSVSCPPDPTPTAIFEDDDEIDPETDYERFRSEA